MRLPHRTAGNSAVSENFQAIEAYLTPAPGRAYRNTATKIGAAAWVKIKVDTLDMPDLGPYFDLTNGHYVCPFDGFYQVSGVVAMITEGVTGELLSAIRVNEVSILRGARIGVTVGKPEVINAPVTGLLRCSRSNKIELWAFQNSPGERNLEIASDGNFLSVVRVG